MADKKTRLSIEIGTVDKATAKLKAINARLDTLTKPTRDFKKALSDFGEKSGLDNVVSGFKGVGSALEGVLTKLAVVGGVAGLAVHALFGVVKEFDDLGDAADRVGLTADQLAALRYAAEKAGAPVGALDEGFKHFSENLGQVHAKTGRLYKFLGTISPALQKQVAAAKDNAAAFDLMAGAMAKLHSPADRAALAQKAFGDSALAPLLAKGAKGVKELTDRFHVIAPGMQAAADAGGDVADKLIDLHAATDGAKGALLTGLSPALDKLIAKMTKWLTGHQAEIAKWAEDVGKKLPGAVHELVTWLGKAYDKVSAFVDAIGGIGNAAIGAIAIMAGPLIGSVLSLSGALIKAIANAAKLAKAMGGIPSGVGGLGGGVKAGALGTAESGATVGIGGVLGAAALPAAAGIGLYYGLDALGANREGAYGKLMRMQLEAQRAKDGPDATLRLGLGGSERALLAGRPDVSAQARNATGSMRDTVAAVVAQSLAAAATTDKAKITIDITGAPRGTRAKVDPKSTGNVDLNIGYNLLGAH